MGLASTLIMYSGGLAASLEYTDYVQWYTRGLATSLEYTEYVQCTWYTRVWLPV